jgi:alpha-galactosidase
VPAAPVGISADIPCRPFRRRPRRLLRAGWAFNRSADGSINPDPALFPNGMKAVVDYVHSKGLTFGIYTARGSTTCMGKPGSDSYEAQDARTYASWGVDFLKEGACCGAHVRARA